MIFPWYNKYKIKLIKYSILFLLLVWLLVILWNRYFANIELIDSRDFIAAKFLKLINWKQDISGDIKLIDNPLDKDSENKINQIIGQNQIKDSNLIDDLNNYIANIKLLQNDYDTSLEKLTGEDWKYYYNLWNVQTLKWYDLLNMSGYAQVAEWYWFFQQAIENYNKSSQLMWTWDDEWKKIINNRNKSYYLRYLGGLKIVMISLTKITNTLNELLDKVLALTKILDEESELIKSLMDSNVDKNTRECLLLLNKELGESMVSVSNIKDFLNYFKSGLVKKYEKIVEDPDNLLQNIDTLSGSVGAASSKISISLDEFLKQYWYKNIALRSKNTDIIKSLCESWRSWWQDNKNAQLNEWIDELNKLLWDNPWDEQKQTQKSDDQPIKNWDQPMHQNIPQWYEKQLMENIMNQNKSWINEMQQLKSQSWYDPKQYLDKLFKDFLWNQKDFSNQTWGTLEQYDNSW